MGRTWDSDPQDTETRDLLVLAIGTGIALLAIIGQARGWW